tara:strand:+ start:309 stop:704 length:396 start_codon:yes stop_codon:yes gene_type:complete
MFTSLLLHQNEIKKRIEIGKNKLLYESLNKVIELSFFTYNQYISFKNYIFKNKSINYGYDKLNKVNNFYLVGRNKLLTEMGKLTFNAVSPFPSAPMIQPQVQSNNLKKEKVFKDDKDMNSFLDSLVNKKDQ